MKRRNPLFGFLAGLFLGILMDILILYLVIEYDLISKYSDTVLALLELFLILYPVILGVIGYSIEKKHEKIDVPKLKAILDKTRKWKKEGYDVSEIETKIKKVK